MYAIVEIAGQQFRAEKAKFIYVHRMQAELESRVEFDKVLLLDKEGEVMVGKPVVEGTTILAKVLDHVRGDKVHIFKKKRRKGYQKRTGHRQDFTKIEVLSIMQNGASITGEIVENAPVVKAEPNAAVKKVAKVKAEVEAPAKKKAPAKKEAAPKAEKKEAPAKEKKSAKKESK